MVLRVPTASLLLAAGLAVPSVVGAESGVPGQVKITKSPYWQVGTLDRDLSLACQRGEFIQQRLLHLNIGYIGPRGKGITGIATKEWNLIDVRRRAKTGFTYHFLNQGYSNCRVYVARTPRRRQ